MKKELLKEALKRALDNKMPVFVYYINNVTSAYCYSEEEINNCNYDDVAKYKEYPNEFIIIWLKRSEE